MPSLTSLFRRAQKVEKQVPAPTELDTMLSALRASTVTMLDPAIKPDERKAALQKTLDQFRDAVLTKEPAVLIKQDEKPKEEEDKDEEDDEDTDDEEPMMKGDDIDALDVAISKRIEQVVGERTATLQKQLETATAEKTELHKRLESVEQARATEARIAKAKDLAGSTGQKPEAIAAVLEKIEGNEAAMAAFTTTLEALKKAQSDAALYEVLGHGAPPTDGQTRVEARAAELQKADPKLTRPQAIAKAAREMPQDAFRSTVPGSR